MDMEILRSITLGFIYGKDKRVQGLLNFYKQINTYLQINVNVIKSKVTGDKRGYTVAFDRKD